MNRPRPKNFQAGHIPGEEGTSHHGQPQGVRGPGKPPESVPEPPPQNDFMISLSALPQDKDLEDLDRAVKAQKMRKEDLQKVLDENVKLKKQLEMAEKKVWMLKGEVNDVREEMEEMERKLEGCIAVDEDGSADDMPVGRGRGKMVQGKPYGLRSSHTP